MKNGIIAFSVLLLLSLGSTDANAKSNSCSGFKVGQRVTYTFWRGRVLLEKSHRYGRISKIEGSTARIEIDGARKDGDKRIIKDHGMTGWASVKCEELSHTKY